MSIKIRPTRRTVLAAGAAAGTTLAMPAVHAQTREIRFLNAEPAVDSVRAIRIAAAQYEREKGVKVTVDTVPTGEAYNRTVAAIRGGRPYDISTIIFVAHVLTLANQGHLTPVTDLVRKHQWGKRILFPINGQHYWYMYDYNLCWMNYRKDIYGQLGLTVPKTWNAFLENCRKSMVTGATPRFGLTTPIGSNDATNWMAFAYMWADGVTLYDDQWRFQPDRPEVRAKLIAFLDFFAELYKTMPPGMANISFGQVMSQFAAEQAVHAPYAGRIIEVLEQRAPNLTDKYGMFPYPGSTGGTAVNHGYDGWVVGNTPMKEESIKFLEWFSDYHYINFLHSAPLHFMPARLDIYDDPRWRAHPLIEKHAEAVKTMQGFLTDPNIVIRSIDTEGPIPDLRPAKIFESYALPEMLQAKCLNNAPTEQTVDQAIDKMKRAAAS